ncbi:YgaP family membrane protein [Lacunimicrobium album]
MSTAETLAAKPYASTPACATKANISENEKWMSLAAGAYLGLSGFKQGGLTGVLSIAAGAGLLYRGLTNHCYLYDQLGINTAKPDMTAVPYEE